MVGQMANWLKWELYSWPISLFTLASQGLACTSEGGRSKTLTHRCLSATLIQPFSASCQAAKDILNFATLHDALIPNPKVFRDELMSCLGLIGSAIQGQEERTGIPIPMSVSLSNLLAANTRWSWFKTWIRIPQAAIKGNVGRISGGLCRLGTC